MHKRSLRLHLAAHESEDDGGRVGQAGDECGGALEETMRDNALAGGVRAGMD